MAGKVIEGSVELVMDRDKLLSYVKRDNKEVTLEGMADAIHGAFCEPRGMGGLAGEIHRRQHIEIARALFERLP